jgi:hypothetical protein
VIERIFGVFKKRFKVLVVPQEYSLYTQAQIVSALAVLHNFIRIYDPDDLLDDTSNNDEDELDIHGRLQNQVTAEERGRAVVRRDEIAKAMWADYSTRGRR